MRLERITVQAFRGYPSRADVVLSGDVVLLSGENGTGKTSLTEAFEWVLFGSIVRKERSKTRGEYQGSSWIRSVHASEEAETFAEITLSEGDRRHVVRRLLVGNGSELTIDGKPVSDVRVLGLRTEDAFRPFLGQCEIQALIDSEQQSRWEQLSAILGFAAFGQLRERLQRLRTDTDRDARVTRLRERVTRAVQPLTPAGKDPLEQSPEELRGRAAGFLGLNATAAWESIRNSAQEELDALLVKDRRPPGLDALIAGARDVGSEATRTAAATKALEAHAEEHRAWHEANRQAAFAAQGLELVDPQEPMTCPFCAEPSLRDSRVAVLREQAGRTTGPAPADPRPALRSGIAVLIESGPLNTDAVPLLMESLGDAAESIVIQEAGAEQATLDDLRERAKRLGDAALAAYEAASRPRGEAQGLKGIVAELVPVVEEVAQRHAALRAQLDAVNVELTQRFSGLGEDDKKRISAFRRLFCWLRTAPRSRLPGGFGTTRSN